MKGGGRQEDKGIQRERLRRKERRGEHRVLLGIPFKKKNQGIVKVLIHSVGINDLAKRRRSRGKKRKMKKKIKKIH